MGLVSGKASAGWLLKKKQVTVTTWKLRLLVLVVAAAVVYVAHPGWLVAVGSSLVHQEQLEPADLLLLENYDANYLVFEAAEELLQSGFSSRVLVPVAVDEETMEPNSVQQGFVEVMGRIAGIEDYETAPVRHIEPISLNVVRQIADLLEAEGIRSVIVVSPRFRSARSYLVYDHVLTPRGIRVQCFAADGPRQTDTWWQTWHGLQSVSLEFLKLIYYRVWVL